MIEDSCGKCIDLNHTCLLCHTKPICVQLIVLAHRNTLTPYGVEHGRMRYEKPQDLPKMSCDSINGYCKQKTVQGNVVISVMKWYNIVTVEVKPVSTSQVSRIQGVHLCSAARCGKNGKCVAQYLGGDVPVTPNACICNDGWSGKLCQFNPCFGKSCSSHGKCTVTSDQDAKCLCNDGFS